MSSRTSFTTDFRQFFLRGLAAILPTVLTIGIIVWVFSKIQQYIGRFINRGLQFVVIRYWVWQESATDPDRIAEFVAHVVTFWNRYLFWVGFLLALVGVYVFGRFIGSFLGRFFWRVTERTIIQLPVIKKIYPSVKQVTDFLLAERKMEFSNVVAVEYPRKGIWSIGLVTNPAMRTLRDSTDEKLVTIFIPSSPTPFTGYTITVKRADTIDLPITIDEALRFTISGGVIQPPSEATPEATIGKESRQVFTSQVDKESAE